MRASIVVLTYNQLEDGTKPCLESIFKFTKEGEYELIVVDNASKDGTPSYLREIERAHPNVKVVLNNTNRGYAGGNNDGIREAKGDFIILLNNDTLMTPNWLDLLLRPMEADESIGLSSPVTNSAGNEQMIVIPNLNESNYIELAGQYVQRHKGYVFETEKLGFYCVAISSEALKKIGLLDENFGIGMFEDDDYCIRAKKAGYRLMINEGCFIYHKGSLSFKKMVDTEYKEIFRRNKEYFSSKHGEEWMFNQITMAFYRQMEREVRSMRDSGQCDRPELERISVRLLGFKFLIENAMNIEKNAAKSGVDTTAQEPRMKRAFRSFKEDFINGGPDKRRAFIRRCYRRVRPLTENAIIAKFGQARKDIRFDRAVIMMPSFDIGADARTVRLAKMLVGSRVLVVFGEAEHGPHDVEVLKRYFANVLLMNRQFAGYLQHMVKREETIVFQGCADDIKRVAPIADSGRWVDVSRPEDLPINTSGGTPDRILLVTLSDPKFMESIPTDLRAKALILPDDPSKEEVDLVISRLCAS